MDFAKAERELGLILQSAERLAEELDPTRTFTAKSETMRAIVKACDQISAQASRALSMIRVTT